MRRRSRSTSESCRSSSQAPASTSTRCGSSSARPRSRTGRCAENFLECYHCQIAHPAFSKVVDVSVDAYVLEQSATFSTQYGPVREQWKATSTHAAGRARPVPLPLAEHHDQRHARPAEPLDRPGRALTTGAHRPLPRLLRRPGRRRRVDRGHARVRRPGRRRGHACSSSACRKGCAAGSSSTGVCCSSPSASSPTSRAGWSTLSPEDFTTR